MGALEQAAQRIVATVSSTREIAIARHSVDVHRNTALLQIVFDPKTQNVFPKHTDPTKWELSKTDAAYVDYVYYRCEDYTLVILLVERTPDDEAAVFAQQHFWEHVPTGIRMAPLPERLPDIPITGLEVVREPALAELVRNVVREVVAAATERGPTLAARVSLNPPSSDFALFVDVVGLVSVGYRTLNPYRWKSLARYGDYIGARVRVADRVHRTAVKRQILPRLVEDAEEAAVRATTADADGDVDVRPPPAKRSR